VLIAGVLAQSGGFFLHLVSARPASPRSGRSSREPGRY